MLVFGIAIRLPFNSMLVVGIPHLCGGIQAMPGFYMDIEAGAYSGNV